MTTRCLIVRPIGVTNPSCSSSWVDTNLITRATRCRGKTNEHHQKVTLKLTDYDFDVACLDRAVLDSLLEMPLEIERLIVPDFFTGPLGESELRADFEKQVTSSLCFYIQ